MNKKEAIQAMVEAVERIESKHSKDKFNIDQAARKNVVKAILDELERVTKDENQ